MADLLYGSNTIGTIITYPKKYTSQKVTNISLDGTPYVQNTGTAIDRRIVHVFCPTAENKDALDVASNTAALLTILESDGSAVKGYIEKDVSWKEWRDGHGVGAFTMIVKEVVNA